MISNARIKKLFAYLAPMLGSRSKKDLDNIYAEIEKILGYDKKKSLRYREDAKERDRVVEALMSITLARANEAPARPPRMSMPEKTLAAADR